MAVEISFRPLVAGHLPLLHEWLQRPHVRRWWGGHETLESVAEHYRPALEGDEPTDLYVIVGDGRAIGFIETYLVADYPEYEAHARVGAGVAGVDLFIADADLLGRGLGPQILQRFARDVVFAREDVHAVVASPRLDNHASIRAFEKAGFERIRVISDPEEPGPHQLLRFDRATG